MTRSADGLTEVLEVPSDEASVIAIKTLREGPTYVPAGSRLPAAHWLPKARPDAFESVTRDVSRDRALRCLYPFYSGDRIELFPGQWVDETDRRATEYPMHFERVGRR